MNRSRWVARRVRVPRALRSPFLVSTTAALLARLLYLLEISSSVLLRLPVGDGRAYHEWGLAIARGDWLGQGVFYQAPLYPYFLGVMHALFGPSLWPARVAQAVIGALGVGACAAAAAHFFGRRAALLGGLILAFYPPLVFYDGLIQKTVFDVALTSVLMLCLARYDAHRTDRRALLAGLVFGFLCLTRENALLLFVAIVPWFLWRSIAPHADGARAVFRMAVRSQLGWIKVALFLGGFLLAVAPVTVRNLTVGGEFALTTAQLGPNLWIGNNPEADGRYRPLLPGRGDARFERDDARSLAEAAVGHRLSPSGVSSYWTGRAIRFASHQPVAWAKLMVRKLRLALSVGEVCDTDAIEAYADASIFLFALGWFDNFGTLASLAAFGLVLTWSHRRSRWLFPAMLGTLAFSVMIFFVAGRYRAPLVPLLAIFAGGASVRMLDWLRYAMGVLHRGGFRRSRRTDLGFTLAILVLAASLIPFPYHRSQRGLNYYAVGSELLERGRNREAEDALTTAVEAYPIYSPAHRKLGVALYRNRRLPDSLKQFDLAIGADPKNAENWIVRGMLLEELGRVTEAARDYEQALALEPTSADAAAARTRLRSQAQPGVDGR